MFDWFKRRKRTSTQVHNNDAVGADPHALGLASHTFVEASSSSDATPDSSPCDSGAFDAGGFDGGGGDCGGGGGGGE